MRPLLLLLALLAPAALAAAGTDFTRVIFHRCYDGDTCTFTLKGERHSLGKEIRIRLRGIDAPEIDGPNPKAAIKARDALHRLLLSAKSIKVVDAERGTYFRLVATILADGVDVSHRTPAPRVPHRAAPPSTSYRSAIPPPFPNR